MRMTLLARLKDTDVQHYINVRTHFESLWLLSCRSSGGLNLDKILVRFISLTIQMTLFISLTFMDIHSLHAYFILPIYICVCISVYR